jgi:hypothetical protein
VLRFRDAKGPTRSRMNPARCSCVGYDVGGPDSEPGSKFWTYLRGFRWPDCLG